MANILDRADLREHLRILRLLIAAAVDGLADGRSPYSAMASAVQVDQAATRDELDLVTDRMEMFSWRRSTQWRTSDDETRKARFADRCHAGRVESRTR